MLEMEPRYFNKLEILDDERIAKSSTDKFKIKAEYEWYTENSWNVNGKYDDITYWVPNVYDFWEHEDRAGYVMEYIHGYTLAWHFLYGTLDIESFIKIIEHFYELVDERPVINVNGYTKMCIHSMYEDKTIERLEKAGIDLDKEFIVNDHKLPSIHTIISECKVDLRDSDIRNIHGDLCLANMIYHIPSLSPALLAKRQRPVEKCVYLIDPRGYLPGNIITAVGDNKYDVAKLAHSFIGRYEQIREHGFNISKMSDKEYIWACTSTDYQKKLEDTFKAVFDKDKYQYYEIMVHLFLSMIPLHKDSPEKQEKMLVNALRLYLERENKF